jgi:excisionase family DNA binding protein
VGTSEFDPLQLIGVRELARLTGLSVGTLYHLVSQQRIPVIRISRRCIRFRPGDIEDWISQNSVPRGDSGPVRREFRNGKKDSYQD